MFLSIVRAPDTTCMIEINSNNTIVADVVITFKQRRVYAAEEKKLDVATNIAVPLVVPIVVQN